MEYPRIRQIREERDLKQKEIAKVLHISQRTYSGYETGIRNIPVQAVVKLAAYYELSVDYLLGLTNVKNPYPR